MKEYIVRLSEAERKTCQEVIKKLKGSSRKRAGRVFCYKLMRTANWCDYQVAEAYGCQERTVANVRKCCVLEGFELALNGDSST